MVSGCPMDPQPSFFKGIIYYTWMRFKIRTCTMSGGDAKKIWRTCMKQPAVLLGNDTFCLREVIGIVNLDGSVELI